MTKSPVLMMVVCISLLLMAGCTGSQGPAQPPSPSVTVTVHQTTPVPMATSATVSPKIPVSTPTTPPSPAATTPVPVHTDSQACPAYGPSSSSPIAKTILLNGTGNAIVTFEAIAPGDVIVTTTTTKVTGCDDSLVGFHLTGRSTCNMLDRTFSPGTTSLHLPNSGKYTITVRGCYDWHVTIAKA